MDSIASPLHAGVRFPPPLAYAAGIVVGWLLDLQWPWRIATQASVWRPSLAAALSGFAIVIMVASVMLFRRAGTSLIPNRPSTTFVVAGPYRFTRNPMYVGLAALYLGVALGSNSWWPVVFLPVVLLVIQRAVIVREERYLSTKFPDTYPEYCRTVRRWL